MNIKKNNPTINDVAKLAGVGKTSVSRYLNGHFSQLSLELSERIKKAIETLDYKPSQLARSIKGGRSKLIAFIVADIHNPYSISILHGLEAACRLYGYILLIFNTNNKLSQEKYILESILSYQVEGVIIQALSVDNTLIRKINVPIVQLDRRVKYLQSDMVGLDNMEAMREIVEHLYQQKFTALLLISESIKLVDTRQQRVNSFMTAINNLENVVGEVFELNSTHQLSSAIEKFYQSYPTDKKAIISVNGSLALPIVASIKALNYHIGTDIGFISIDQLDWCNITEVPLSMLKQPTEQIGKKAFELLLARIEGNSTTYQEIRYKGELVIQQSTMF